jgi:hypothetical protein
MKDAGLGNLPARDISNLRDHGVNPPFVRVAAELGYQFSPQELIDLRNHGVNEEYLKNLRASGMEGLTADTIVKLRTHGVE